jgi:hypothetical protein
MPNGMKPVKWGLDVFSLLQKFQMSVDEVPTDALELMFVRGYTPHQAATRLLALRARGLNPTDSEIPPMNGRPNVEPLAQKK